MPVALPKFLKTAFAAVGIKNNIPDASDNVTGRAGYDKGFPEVNMQPREAGGIPPAGGDMNGVLYDLSASIQYVQSGITFPFNQEFATSIGGYQIGAIVSSSSDGSILWINGVANNKSFPYGWTSFKYSDPTETSRGTPFVATPNDAMSMVNSSKMITPKGLVDAFTGSNQNASQSGFQRLPGGIILQWLTVPILNNTAGSENIFTWPIPFPNSIFGVSVNMISAGTTGFSMGVGYVDFGSNRSQGKVTVGKDDVRNATGAYVIGVGR